MAVNTYALCSLVGLKAHLGITVSTDDTILEGYIDSASSRIEDFIGYRVLQRNYSEWYGGSGNRTIKLRNFPINLVTAVYTGMTAAITVSSSTSTDIQATISVNPEPQGGVSQGLLSPNLTVVNTTLLGVSTTSERAYSTYPYTSSLATNIDGITGFNATLVQNMKSSQLHPRAGADALQSTVTLTGANVACEFAYDSRTGTVTIREDRMILSQDWDSRFPYQPLSTLVEYSAGYATVPDSIRQCALEESALMFLSRRVDDSLQSESIGDYSYSRSGADRSQRVRLESALADWREIR